MFSCMVFFPNLRPTTIGTKYWNRFLMCLCILWSSHPNYPTWCSARALNIWTSGNPPPPRGEPLPWVPNHRYSTRRRNPHHHPQTGITPFPFGMNTPPPTHTLTPPPPYIQKPSRPGRTPHHHLPIFKQQSVGPKLNLSANLPCRFQPRHPPHLADRSLNSVQCWGVQHTILC